MGKKAKRKNNKQHLRPPLTFLDKSIYFLCIVFSVLSAFALVYCFDDIKNLIAFNKPSTVAYTSSASFLFVFPFMLFLEISALILFISGWESKKPIFGSKKYKYGEYPYREDCFPLFSRKKYNLRQNPSKKKFIRRMAALWCSVLLVLACLIPFGLFGRDTLYEDNHIEKINFLNITSDIYDADNFSHLTIRTKYVSSPKSHNYWAYEITIEMKDGKDFTFSNMDFDRRMSGVKDICLNKMLEIKGLFAPNAITVQKSENINNVAEHLNFNEQQFDKLKELFSE